MCLVPCTVTHTHTHTHTHTSSGRRQLVDGRERFVFWAAPHVALSLEGDVGKV